MTLPADHRWRCECGADHFLVITWNGIDPDGVADAGGEIGVEDKPSVTWRYRIALAWQLLRNGHSATGVSVQLDAAKAREIAAVLSDFADDASATAGEAGETEAEMDAAVARHEAWAAAGRPGAMSHADAMAELLDPEDDDDPGDAP